MLRIIRKKVDDYRKGMEWWGWVFLGVFERWVVFCFFKYRDEVLVVKVLSKCKYFDK